MPRNTPTRPTATTEWLLEHLREAITHGEYPPGTPVRQETLAAHYDVSRMPVRAALQHLEAEGWIEHRPHRGAYVAPLDPDDVAELFAVRAVLETLGVRRGVPSLTSADTDAAAHALDTLEQSAGSDWFAAHKAFHLSLHVRIGRRLYRLIDQHLDAAERYLRLENAVLDVAGSDRREHRALLAAAREGDGEGAAGIMHRHLEGSGERLAARLRDAPPGLPT